MSKRKSMADRLREQGSATVAKLDDARKKLKDISSIDETIDETIDRTIDCTIDIPNVSSNERSNVSPIKKARSSSNVSSIESPNVSPIVSSNKKHQKAVVVNKTDFFVIVCLQILDGNPTTMNRISECTDISSSTIKSSIQRLIKKGVIENYNGKVFVMNQRCFAANVSQIKLNLNGDLKRVKAKIRQFNTEKLFVVSSNVSSNLYSSSSYIKKTTTTTESKNENSTLKNLNDILTQDPELKFWCSHNIDAKQVFGWMIEFGIDFPKMIQNLRYCRWIIENENLTIKKSVADYFYGMMKKSGGTVNKPIAYKSFLEIEHEAMDKWKNEMSVIVKKRQQLNQRHLDIRIDTILETLNPENPILAEAIELVSHPIKRQRIKKTIEAGKPLDKSQTSSLKGILRRILSNDSPSHF